jgi:hypothetical protein
MSFPAPLPTPVSTPTILISINELMTSNAALVAIEQGNKQRLETLDTTLFIQNLHTWAGAGYTDSFIVYNFSIVAPTKVGNLYKSSDGTNKTIWDYIPFCLGYPILTLVENIQARISGINLTFSLSEDPTVVLSIHASK